MKPDMPEREHLFYMVAARSIFLHPHHGIVIAEDPIRLDEAKAYLLEPLLLYGVTLPGMPVRYVRFARLNDPLDLAVFFKQAWECESLRGRPDVIRVSTAFLDACPPFQDFMASQGVEVRSAPNDKTLSAVMRAAQERTLTYRAFGFDKFPHQTLEDLNAIAMRDETHASSLKYVSTAGSPAMRDLADRWLTFDMRGLLAPFARSLVAVPGPSAFSWQASLRWHLDRHWKIDDDSKQAFLMSGELPQTLQERLIDGDELDSDFSSPPILTQTDLTREYADLLDATLKCWPNPLPEVAKALGISAAELQRYASGKVHTTPSIRALLARALPVSWDLSYGGWTVYGPALFVARNLHALGELYSGATGGGDAYPVEIVPEEGLADFQWRYFFFNGLSRGMLVVAVEANSPLADRMEVPLFNMVGSLPVPRQFYEDLQVCSRRAMVSPAHNRAMMQPLVEIYEPLLDQILEMAEDRY